MSFVFALLLLLCPSALWEAHAQSGRPVDVERFEVYKPGGLPERWKFFTSKNEVRPLDDFMTDEERVWIVRERGNQFLRAMTDGEALRISLANQPDFDLDWSLSEHPELAWRWRAHHLPEGASEKGRNDTGAAVYVTFSRDWLGRPKSIKYTYSSSLPVGTVVSFGRLKVIVVATGAEGVGKWVHVRRNVAEDYRQVFGEKPPDRPLLITIWSDSDDTRDRSEVDIDDILLMPEGGPN